MTWTRPNVQVLRMDALSHQTKGWWWLSEKRYKWQVSIAQSTVVTASALERQQRAAKKGMEDANNQNTGKVEELSVSGLYQDTT